MLKKLNGQITKMLFNIKKNFLSLLFKLSVLTTMLILIYLVCVLRQADSLRRRDYDDAYPIENSQKLMLTTSTEIPSDLDTPTSTIEAPTTSGNFISKADDYIETHPLFPLQKQTTTPSVPIQVTTQCHKQWTTEETRVLPTPKPTIPFKRSLSLDELSIWETSTLGLKEEATLRPEVLSSVEEKVEEEGTSTTTDIPDVITDTDNSSTTSTPVPVSDDLFMDNWSNYFPTEGDNRQINPPEEATSPLNDIKEPPESIFLNEDNESGALESPNLETESENISDSNIEDQIPPSAEEITQNSEAFEFEHVDKGSVENKMFSFELPPFPSPANLFNLFTLDHLPASSNMKPKWWPKSRKPSVPLRSQKRHTNSIRPSEEESEETSTSPKSFKHVKQFQGLDTLLNQNIKDSVNFLERLFSNFHQ